MTTREYAPGRTRPECERLRCQARLWEPDTAALLDRVDLQPGAICADVGCGSGEAMRLMADRVGPAGLVLGVDVDVDLGRDAIERLDATGYRQCHFIRADIESPTGSAAMPVGSGFDLVFARLILGHLCDPVAALRRMWAWTAPGGSLVVQELNLRSLSVLPRLDVVSTWLEFFAGLDPGLDLGHRLPALFTEAGIGEPDDSHVGTRMGRLDGPISGLLTDIYCSALPTALARDQITEAESDRWLAAMADVVATAGHHIALWPSLVGVRKRKPA
jgi:SAM-dependent methyltransferase